jgi:hypothetical protein
LLTSSLPPFSLAAGVALRFDVEADLPAGRLEFGSGIEEAHDAQVKKLDIPDLTRYPRPA